MKIFVGQGALPVGALHFAAAQHFAATQHNDAYALVAVGFAHQWPSLQERLRKVAPAAAFVDGDPLGMAARLGRYAAGALDAFDGVAVAPHGTPFQKRVWAALCRIPAGTTCSYLDVARALGAPTATRAVGAANGQNPIALVIPCHRVIGQDGSLTGYAGRVENKRWLLAHEAAQR